jgi:hypothetical protein
MKNISRLLVVGVFILMVFGSAADINNEQAIMADIQGTWTGYQQTGSLYRHFKLNFRDSEFDGWMEMSDTSNEPEWNALPGESGTVSLSSVLEMPNETIKIRKIKFSASGRCCGDISLTAKTLSSTIAYKQDQGLYIEGAMAMQKNTP